MRRFAALAVGLVFLLLTPGAPGSPDVPGDPTPPVITPVINGTLGDAGWYTSNVTVNWSVTDPESIILSTSGCNAITLSANTTGLPLTCSAESDGGKTTVTKTFKVDKTAPAATASPSRTADANGWYNHPLTVSLSATDGTSGVASCSASASYAGPDTAGTSVGGSCRDRAGNTSLASVGLKYDATPPSATASASRSADANGWYNHSLTVGFAGSDATSGLQSCDPAKAYQGPDVASVSIGGACRDQAGNVSASASFAFKYDESSPKTAAAPSRLPDANGWYNRALTVAFSGTDDTSGVAGCTSIRYAGPDDSTGTLSGSCRDVAGNVSSSSFVFKYDATAPAVSALTARPGARSADLAWRTSSDTKEVEVFRAPGRNGQGESIVYRGSGTGVRDSGLTVGRKYEYRVVAIDEASNRAEKTLDFVATGPLLSPAPGASVSAPPRLRWTAVRGASYYNVQLIRGHKVFSAWPARPGIRLRRTWTYRGRRYRLRPGVYRWYVWPGFGPRSANRYGRRPLGTSTFVVTK